MRISVLKKAALPVFAVFALGGLAAKTLAVEPVDNGMAWLMTQEGSKAKLAYGLPNSDQLALMMTCAPGDASAVVYGDVQPRGARLTQASFSPSAIDPLSGGDALEARIALSHPSLTGLANRGSLNVEDDAGGYTLTASREDRRVVQDFLAYCGAGRA